MNKKINCIYNDDGAWCKNENIKRSLFGFGARVCLCHNDIECSYKEEIPKPLYPPKAIK
jgi:hypothetical protein